MEKPCIAYVRHCVTLSQKNILNLHTKNQPVTVTARNFFGKNGDFNERKFSFFLFYQCGADFLVAGARFKYKMLEHNIPLHPLQP